MKKLISIELKLDRRENILQKIYENHFMFNKNIDSMKNNIKTINNNIILITIYNVLTAQTNTITDTQE